MVYLDFKKIDNNKVYDLYYYKPGSNTLFVGEWYGWEIKDAIVHKEIIPTRGITEKEYKGQVLQD